MKILIPGESVLRGAHKTIEYNDIIKGIIKLGEHFDKLEKGQASISGSLFEEVTPSGFKPETY